MVQEPKFRHIVQNPLDDDLGVGDVHRLLRKDVGANQRFPGETTVGARHKGVFTVFFWANVNAGDFNDAIPLDYATIPLCNVWFLGTVDTSGNVTPGGGLLASSWDSSSTVINGTPVFSGATACYTVTKDQLQIAVTSTNVGWPSIVVAYFYYSTYYDVIDYTGLGLAREF